MQELLDMTIHQSKTLNDGTHILRVPGGWVYTIFQQNQIQNGLGQWYEQYIPSSVFVPEQKSDFEKFLLGR